MLIIQIPGDYTLFVVIFYFYSTINNLRHSFVLIIQRQNIQIVIHMHLKKFEKYYK